MTALELLATCKAVGVDLHARGGRLKYEAPVGALTPDLRSKMLEVLPKSIRIFIRVTSCALKHIMGSAPRYLLYIEYPSVGVFSASFFNPNLPPARDTIQLFIT